MDLLKRSSPCFSRVFYLEDGFSVKHVVAPREFLAFRARVPI